MHNKSILQYCFLLYVLFITACSAPEKPVTKEEAINSLDSLINKDPFLDYYRALVCKESEDHVNQLVYLEKLQQNMPAFGGGTIQLINAYAEGKQWDKAVALTKQYKTSKDPDTETLDALYLLYPDLKKKMETVSE